MGLCCQVCSSQLLLLEGVCVCVCACMCVCVFTQWAAARGYSFSNNRQREEGGGVEEVFGEGKKKKPRSPPGLRLAEARRPFTAQIFSSSHDCVG